MFWILRPLLVGSAQDMLDLRSEFDRLFRWNDELVKLLSKKDMEKLNKLSIILGTEFSGMGTAELALHLVARAVRKCGRQHLPPGELVFESLRLKLEPVAVTETVVAPRSPMVRVVFPCSPATLLSELSKRCTADSLNEQTMSDKCDPNK